MKRRAAQQPLRPHRRRRHFDETPVQSFGTDIQLILDLVITSGFLYRHDCKSIAATCKKWRDVWREAKDHLPEGASIESYPLQNFSRRFYAECNDSGTVLPRWVKDPALLVSTAFLRKVFDTVRDLKIRAKSTKKARSLAQRTLPRFADFEVAIVMVWGPSRRQGTSTSGIQIELGMKRHVIVKPATSSRPESQMLLKNGFYCQLSSDFILTTGIRSWRVYDRKPLWP